MKPTQLLVPLFLLITSGQLMAQDEYSEEEDIIMDCLLNDTEEEQIQCLEAEHLRMDSIINATYNFLHKRYTDEGDMSSRGSLKYTQKQWEMKKEMQKSIFAKLNLSKEGDVRMCLQYLDATRFRLNQMAREANRAK
ncbi:MAG: hypothetical protein HRT72_00800 [Flavobacteriales bacterium]|nr:hypothetical protein [Flavobacteriales bacterium]